MVNSSLPTINENISAAMNIALTGDAITVRFFWDWASGSSAVLTPELFLDAPFLLGMPSHHDTAPSSWCTTCCAPCYARRLSFPVMTKSYRQLVARSYELLTHIVLSIDIERTTLNDCRKQSQGF